MHLCRASSTIQVIPDRTPDGLNVGVSGELPGACDPGRNSADADTSMNRMILPFASEHDDHGYPGIG